MPFVPKVMVDYLAKSLLVTWQHPEDSLFADGAILVNRHGEPLLREIASPERELAIARQPEKTAYVLLDRRLADRYNSWPQFISTAPQIAYAYVDDYLRMRPDVAISGESLDLVATERGVPSDILRRTVELYKPELPKTARTRIVNRQATAARGRSMGAARTGKVVFYDHRGRSLHQPLISGARRERRVSPGLLRLAKMAQGEWSLGSWTAHRVGDHQWPVGRQDPVRRNTRHRLATHAD